MTPHPRDSSELAKRAALYFALGAAGVVGAAFGLMRSASFTHGFLVGALVPFGTVSLIAVANIADHHPFAHFGAANTLTLTRLIVCALLGGLAFELAFSEAVLDRQVAWTFCTLAALAIVFDGLDGYAARKQGMASDFGSRFDMEVDALQILILCLIALALGKAGLWILIGGALRYAYEVAGVFWPVLQRPLPPSFRRKFISVVQGSALAALLAPVIVPPLSPAVAAIALTLLVYSFAVDVVWLVRDDARARKAVS